MKLDLEPKTKIKSQLQSQAGVVSYEKAKAHEIKVMAERLAPKKTHYYVEHLEEQAMRFPAGPSGFHVYVATTDFAGHMIEWGAVTFPPGKGKPPYAPLRRAARAVDGIKLREDPKGAFVATRPEGLGESNN